MSTTFLARTITTRTLLDGTLTVTLIPTLRPTLALLRQRQYRTSEAPLKLLHVYYNLTIIRVAQKPITTLRRLLTNVKDKDKPEDRQGAVYKIIMLWLPGFLHWWNRQKPKHTTDRTQTRDEEVATGNWSLSSDPEVGLTWANQGLDTRRLANRDWWAKEKRPCFQVSEQYNELIANQKIEGSEQNVARKSDFQHAGARVKVMFKVTSCQVQSVSEKTLCQNKV